MFAVLEGLESDLGAELNFAGGLDDHVDPFGLAQQPGIVGDGILTPGDGILELGNGFDLPQRLDAGLAVGPFGLGEGAVGNGDQAHAGDRRNDLQGGAAPHVTGADDGDAYRVVLLLAFFEGLVDDNHYSVLL